MFAYELFLVHTTFSEYMFHAPRTDFISANREGVYSLVGYISLQLIGTGFGRFILADMVETAD